MKNKTFVMLSVVLTVVGIILPLRAAWAIPADNSAVNRRDQNTRSLTAQDQGNGAKDLDVTRQIRRGIMNRDWLSTYAQNVKIIANGGVVTLKGPVRSQAEKVAVASIARSVVGARNVRNEIEIAVRE
jgi:hyperosmotically inducible protein